MTKDEELMIRCYASLDWMIKSFDFQNHQTGIEGEDSPELKDAKTLRFDLIERLT